MAAMRTLVLSDLHLGCGGDPGIFAGGHALAEVLTRLAAQPLRVVLNGDTFDFLAQDGADDVAYALTRDPTNAAVLTALGRVIDRGGSLIVRGGRHDREVALADVQAHIVRGLGTARATSWVWFHAGGAPSRCDVGGARVLVGQALPADWVGDAADDRELAQRLINPLRRQFGVGLADLLRPHPTLAALAAVAVNPTAVKHVLRDLPGDARAVVHRLQASRAFAQAGLTPREEAVLVAAIDPGVVLGIDAYDDGALRRARLKLLRASLREAAPAGEHPRALTTKEWASARALARRDGASAVIFGQSHAVGWRADEGLVACDTGAWTWLVRSPPADESDEAWLAYLEQWQRAPRIDARLSGPPPTRLAFTGALIEARAAGRGARVALIEWRRDELVVLREQAVPAARGG